MIGPIAESLKPACGGAGSPVSDDIKSFFAPLLGIAGGAGTVAGIVKQIISLAAFSLVAAILAYAAIQVTVMVLLGLRWRQQCREPNKGLNVCVSGVVNAVHDAEIKALPFLSRHPHVDLVVKSVYWLEFSQPGRKYVYCTDTGPRGTRSPVLKVFFRSDRVCTILAASFFGSLGAPLVAIAAFNGIGATIGASTLAGSIGFILFAALFWFAALAAALIAGGIAAAAADNDTPQATEDDGTDGVGVPDSAQAVAIAVGDLLTVQGPAAIDDNVRGSIVVRFVESDKVLALGSIANVKAAPYTYVDADASIPDSTDICVPEKRPPLVQPEEDSPEPFVPVP